MKFSPSLCNVQCACGHLAPLEQFTDLAISGTLPEDHFQCPACNRAWKRAKGPPKYRSDIFPTVQIQPTGPRL